jgi:hypothetical protein
MVRLIDEVGNDRPRLLGGLFGLGGCGEAKQASRGDGSEYCQVVLSHVVVPFRG